MNAAALKLAALNGKQRLDKLGKIGEEIAEITSLGFQKGISATEVILDWARTNPELVTAEGGLLKFTNNFFENNKELIGFFKE